MTLALPQKAHFSLFIFATLCWLVGCGAGGGDTDNNPVKVEEFTISLSLPNDFTVREGQDFSITANGRASQSGVTLTYDWTKNHLASGRQGGGGSRGSRMMPATQRHYAKNQTIHETAPEVDRNITLAYTVTLGAENGIPTGLPPRAMIFVTVINNEPYPVPDNSARFIDNLEQEWPLSNTPVLTPSNVGSAIAATQFSLSAPAQFERITWVGAIDRAATEPSAFSLTLIGVDQNNLDTLPIHLATLTPEKTKLGQDEHHGYYLFHHTFDTPIVRFSGEYRLSLAMLDSVEQHPFYLLEAPFDTNVKGALKDASTATWAPTSYGQNIRLTGFCSGDCFEGYSHEITLPDPEPAPEIEEEPRLITDYSAPFKGSYYKARIEWDGFEPTITNRTFVSSKDSDTIDIDFYPLIPSTKFQREIDPDEFYGVWRREFSLADARTLFIDQSYESGYVLFYLNEQLIHSDTAGGASSLQLDLEPGRYTLRMEYANQHPGRITVFAKLSGRAEHRIIEPNQL